LSNTTYGRIDSDGLSFRTKDFCSAFERGIGRILDKDDKIDTVIILGDIFENPHPPSNVRSFFQAQMRRLSAAGIETILLVGNHDACQYHHALQVVIGTDFPHIQVHYAPLIVENSSTMMLVFPHSEAIEKQETTFRESFLQFARASAGDVARAKKQGKDVILLGHFPVYGANRNDYSVNADSSNITVADISSTGADFAFLGDYHASQIFESRTNVMYVGSLERTTFGDILSKKGWVIYDSSAKPEGKMWKAVFEVSPTRPFVDLDVTPENMDSVLAAASSKVDEAIVRVTFCGTTEEYKDFCSKKAAVKAALSQAKHIVPFEAKIYDPSAGAVTEAIRKEMQSKGNVGVSDMLDIVKAAVEAETHGADSVEASMKVVNDVMSTVKSLQSVTAEGKPGRIRLHGVKMHNFQRYGENANVVEFDREAGQFLGILDSSGKLRAQGKEEVFKAAKTFVSKIDPEKKHLISIIGQIEGDDRESNGAGKSSILEAISYAFFERLAREFAHKDSYKGISTTSVVMEVGDKLKSDCYVDVVFSSEGELWLVRRGRKVSKGGTHTSVLSLICLSSEDGQEGSISGHRKKGSEEALAQLVQMDYETFVNSVMFGQNEADRFITGTDKVKKDILAKVLRLTVLDNCLEEIRERKKNAAKDLESVEIQISSLRSQITPGEKKDLERKIASDESAMASVAGSLSSKQSELDVLRAKSPRAECDKVEADLSSKQAEIDRVAKDGEAKLQALRNVSVDAAKRASKAEQEAEAAERQKADAGRELEAVRKAIEGFDEADVMKKLALVEKAKEAKPKRQAERLDMQRKMTELSKQKGKLEGKIELLDKDLGKFRIRLSSCAPGGVMRCPECESEVPRSHFEAKVAEKEAERQKNSELLVAAVAEMAALQAQMSEVGKKLENIDEYVGKEVSLAASLKDQQRCIERVSEFGSRIAELDTRAKSLRVDTGVESTAAAEADRQALNLVGETRGMLAPLEEECGRLRMVIKEAKSKLEAHAAQISSLEKDVADLQSRKDSLISGISAGKARIEMIEKTGEKIAALSSELEQKKAALERLKVIEKIFGLDGIRTHLMRKYVPLLNSYIADFMEVMSRGRISVAVTMDEATSELGMEITGSSASRAELVSKGEFVRIKLAVDLALGLLSLAKNDNAPDFVCLDEIFANVDPAGKEMMFDVIGKLQKQFRMVIVISHDQAVKERIKDTIVVNKVDDVSRIEKQTFLLAV